MKKLPPLLDSSDMLVRSLCFSTPVQDLSLKTSPPLKRGGATARGACVAPVSPPRTRASENLYGLKSKPSSLLVKYYALFSKPENSKPETRNPKVLGFGYNENSGYLCKPRL